MIRKLFTLLLLLVGLGILMLIQVGKIAVDEYEKSTVKVSPKTDVEQVEILE